MSSAKRFYLLLAIIQLSQTEEQLCLARTASAKSAEEYRQLRLKIDDLRCEHNTELRAVNEKVKLLEGEKRSLKDRIAELTVAQEVWFFLFDMLLFY